MELAYYYIDDVEYEMKKENAIKILRALRMIYDYENDEIKDLIEDISLKLMDEYPELYDEYEVK